MVNWNDRPPEPLQADHDLSKFDNGKHATLNEWLKLRAFASEGLSARTFVICAEAKEVVGYYTVSAALEQRAALPTAKLRRGMPDDVPLLLIGRLAIDHRHQGAGLGAALLIDAMRRCLSVSKSAGVRGVVVHAIDDDAVRFYERHQFIRSPLGERTLFLPIETVDALVGDKP